MKAQVEVKQESLFGERDRVLNGLTLEVNLVEADIRAATKAIQNKELEIVVLKSRKEMLKASLKIVESIAPETSPEDKGKGPAKKAGKK